MRPRVLTPVYRAGPTLAFAIACWGTAYLPVAIQSARRLWDEEWYGYVIDTEWYVRPVLTLVALCAAFFIVPARYAYAAEDGRVRWRPTGARWPWAVLAVWFHVSALNAVYRTIAGIEVLTWGPRRPLEPSEIAYAIELSYATIAVLMVAGVLALSLRSIRHPRCWSPRGDLWIRLSLLAGFLNLSVLTCSLVALSLC